MTEYKLKGAGLEG